MTWFKVSDDFHSHPKAMAAGPAAVGLWTLAGSWSSDTLNGGFVPDYVIPRLCADGPTLARKLVAAGLWSRVKGGYRYHQWNERNPDEKTAQSIKQSRSDAAKKANHERWHVSKKVTEPSCDWCIREGP